MSITWGAALRKAYPRQEGRFRPSGIADCIKKQAASAAGVPPTDDQPLYVWQQELGRSGQEIALRAMQWLGFSIEHWLVEKTDVNGVLYLERVKDVTVRGVLPGEADGKGDIVPGNFWGLEPGESLAEIKLRNTYAYTHVWRGNDLMAIDDGRVALQAQVYMGELKLKRVLIGLFPFDSAAVRRDKRFNSKDSFLQDMSEYCRWFLGYFQPELYQIAMERLAYGRVHGKDPSQVPPEFDALTTNFPCNYCDWKRWCLSTGRGNQALERITPVPKTGMPIEEIFLP